MLAQPRQRLGTAFLFSFVELSNKVGSERLQNGCKTERLPVYDRYRN
jgi:hypothetical protein